MTPRKPKGAAKVAAIQERLQHFTIEYEPLRAWAPNAYNPNRQSDHEFQLLVTSMHQDGFTQPCMVRPSDGRIVDGEHRWTAWIVLCWLYVAKRDPMALTSAELRDLRERRAELLAEVGDQLFPVVKVEMTDVDARISTFRMNRARGTEDVQLAALVFQDLRELGGLDRATEGLLLDARELELLLDDIPAPEALAADEFGEAWDHDGGWDPAVDGRVNSDGKAVSMTPAALDNRRMQERKLAEAKTAEEREMARADESVYRLVCVFSGEEGELIREVFPSPGTAHRVLAAARYFAQHPEEAATAFAGLLAGEKEDVAP